MSNALDVTDDSFQSEVLESEVPVLVDFWAPWCGPCRAMGPAVDSLAAEMGDKLKVVKINTEENPSKGSELGVMAIPCFIVFKGGAEVARHMGVMGGDEFKKFVEPHV